MKTLNWRNVFYIFYNITGVKNDFKKVLWWKMKPEIQACETRFRRHCCRRLFWLLTKFSEMERLVRILRSRDKQKNCVSLSVVKVLRASHFAIKNLAGDQILNSNKKPYKVVFYYLKSCLYLWSQDLPVVAYVYTLCWCKL